MGRVGRGDQISPYARAREGVTGNQHLARLSRCKRAHIRLLSAPRSERATDTRAIQDYLGHRRSPRPCATPPSRRTASGGSGGTEGPIRDQNKKGACRTKLHRERRRRWRLGWSRRGSASAVSWSLPRARARRVRFGPPDRLSPLGEVYLQPTLTAGHG